MGNQDDLEVLVEYEGGTYIEGIRMDKNWVSPPYEIHIDELKFVRDDYRMALALGAVGEAYDEVDLSLGKTVPIPVALDGKPAIASYLHGVQERPKPEVAEIMDVSEKTVTKYLSRFRPDLQA